MMIQSVWKNLTGLQKAAEHLWCDFKWAKNSSPNTNNLYINYMDKSTGTPSLEEKKARSNCANKDGNIINVLKNCTQFWSVWKDCWICIGVWWWVFCYKIRSTQFPRISIVYIYRYYLINVSIVGYVLQVDSPNNLHQTQGYWTITGLRTRGDQLWFLLMSSSALA